MNETVREEIQKQMKIIKTKLPNYEKSLMNLKLEKKNILHKQKEAEYRLATKKVDSLKEDLKKSNLKSPEATSLSLRINAAKKAQKETKKQRKSLYWQDKRARFKKLFRTKPNIEPETEIEKA